MYRLAKKILSKLIPTKQLVKHEVFLRNAYSILYTGSSHQCPVCSKKLRTFSTLPNKDLLCPKCGSLSRDRRLWTVLNTGFLDNSPSVLDFSPSRCLSRKMKTVKGIKYMSTDLSGNFIADFKYDITQLDVASNSLDLIICYHVLEHIENDAKAMEELYRVLKPNGKALIQTPFKEGDIYEDFSIQSPQEREIHFGQDDHVRVYSVNGLKGRLQNAGFTVNATTYKADVYHGLANNETVLTITKP
ncbi:class I SAM-dependent methyltransferase [Flavobacterium subsaxonicum]|uniref:Methyltransferase n=1 Tax=Flavobacterium subsaxonicum WB 4.1-42 = DSM 21790 TaxID=1121898 RepID=A0A0A2MIX3_9FLAO|nr:class I SAM-dependent methyltransferase [Flavobacterium subsaxonicum]KGO92577.1 methyltransferase [Flavobacterium subsaxonicum WB 4.1-42 = DSM 21790]